MEEGIAPATCEICGSDFEIELNNSRCEECKSLCCRDCMKINYSKTHDGHPVIRRALCYHCFHRAGDGNVK